MDFHGRYSHFSRRGGASSPRGRHLACTTTSLQAADVGKPYIRRELPRMAMKLKHRFWSSPRGEPQPGLRDSKNVRFVEVGRKLKGFTLIGKIPSTWHTLGCGKACFIYAVISTPTSIFEARYTRFRLAVYGDERLAIMLYWPTLRRTQLFLHLFAVGKSTAGSLMYTNVLMSSDGKWSQHQSSSQEAGEELCRVIHEVKVLWTYRRNFQET